MHRVTAPFGQREVPFLLDFRPVLGVLRRKPAAMGSPRSSEIRSRSMHDKLLAGSEG
jgi:hypothetical protein